MQIMTESEKTEDIKPYIGILNTPEQIKIVFAESLELLRAEILRVRQGADYSYPYYDWTNKVVIGQFTPITEDTTDGHL